MPLAGISELAAEMASGNKSASSLAEECLERIADPLGEGERAFVAVDAERTRAEAQASDLLRGHGIVPSFLAGIPVSVKDLFDVVGQSTTAGSKVLAGSQEAGRDAPPIARLRAAGAVFTGRTNMTEFAYSGVGINPHFGTPKNPFDRATGRIPGGSSSGGVVSVTDGMAAGAIGSDTGGSCRIPAALCGIVGFKPTSARISLDGMLPLSRSLDSVGVMACTVNCVALLDSIMADQPLGAFETARVAGLRLAVPQRFVLNEMEEPVARAFDEALKKLADAGAHLVELDLAALERLPDLALRGGITAAESYSRHAPLITERGNEYDPRVKSRIMLGASISAADYQGLIRLRTEIVRTVDAELVEFDAMVMPTVPVVAPPFSAVVDDDSFTALNKLLLRNPSVANLLDRCAISIPCHGMNEPPVGLSLVSGRHQDRRLLSIGAAVEQLFKASH